MYSSVYIVKQYKDEVGGRGVTDSCWPLWTSVLEHPNSPELLLAFTVAPFALFTCTSASGNFVTPLPPISTYNNTRISQSRPIITRSISSSSSSFPSFPITRCRPVGPARRSCTKTTSRAYDIAMRFLLHQIRQNCWTFQELGFQAGNTRALATRRDSREISHSTSKQMQNWECP